MGLLVPLLSLCTDWALQPRPGGQFISPQAGREHLGRVVQLAGCVLAVHSEVPAVGAWWAELQRRDTQHGQHWVLGEWGRVRVRGWGRGGAFTGGARG
jgi:hypothetical protein